MSDSLWPCGLYSPWNSPGQNTGVGSLSLLQGIFPTQGSNPGLLHCGQILYQLSHATREAAEPQGKPKNTGAGSLSLFQGIFLIQELNWSLLHCRWILLSTKLWGKPCLSLTNQILDYSKCSNTWLFYKFLFIEEFHLINEGSMLILEYHFFYSP